MNKIIFIGNGKLGIPALKQLKEKVVLVVTETDGEAVIRGKRTPKPTRVREFADLLGLDVVTTDDINQPDIIQKIKDCNPNVLIVADFGPKIGDELLSLPAKVLNIHPSLLPKYRGATPVKGAILNGDTKTGVTIIQLTPNMKMDAGQIVFQRRIEIAPEDDIVSLNHKLSELAADMIEEAIENVLLGNVYDQKGQSSNARKLSRKDALFEWNQSADDIVNKVRAFADGEPRGAHLLPSGLFIWKALKDSETTVPTGTEPGTIIKMDRINGFLVVACVSGAIRIIEVQVPGRDRVMAVAYINGARIKVGKVLV